MRDKLIKIWRKLTQIKAFFPLIIFIRWFAATNVFNIVLDFAEVKIFHTSYKTSEYFFEQNKNRIDKIIEEFADEKSKKAYRNIWFYRNSHERKYLRDIVDKKQYFDKDLIIFDTEEIFVDCGAYKGDTVKEFKRHLPDGKYKAIYAFEPDKWNYQRLLNCIHDKQKDHVYNLGTWNGKGKMRFRGNTEEACMIAEDGESVIYTDTIDDIVLDRYCTYIKMDVEGAELNSLKGAKKTITKSHPRLAISIYHSDSDMLEIVEYLMREYPFYKFFVRHYTYFAADTVLYAIDTNKFPIKVENEC